MDPLVFDPALQRQSAAEIEAERARMLASQRQMRVNQLLEQADREEAFAGIGTRQPTEMEIAAKDSADQITGYLNRLNKERDEKAQFLLKNGWDDTLESLAAKMTDSYASQVLPQRIITHVPEELRPELIRRTQELAALRQKAEQPAWYERVGQGVMQGLGRLTTMGDTLATSLGGNAAIPKMDATEEVAAAELRAAPEQAAPINPYRWYDPRYAAVEAPRQLVQMAPAMAGAAMNPALGAAAAAGTVYPQERERMLMGGMSPDNATGAAALSSVAQGAVEMLSPFGGVSPKGTVGAFLKEAAKEALVEEPAQSVISDVAMNAGGARQPVTPEQAAINALKSAAQAAGPAALIGGVGTAMNRMAQPQQPPQGQQPQQALAPPPAPQPAPQQQTVEQAPAPEQKPKPQVPGVMLREAIASGDGLPFVQAFPDKAQEIAALPENPSRDDWRKAMPGLDPTKWNKEARAQARKRVADALAKQPQQTAQTGAQTEAGVENQPVAPPAEFPREEEGQRQEGQAELLAQPQAPSAAPVDQAGAAPQRTDPDVDPGQFVYHRGSDPRTSKRIVLAADNKETIASYGRTEYAIDRARLIPVPQWVQEFANQYYSDEIRSGNQRSTPPNANPNRIVESADVWDDADFVSSLWSTHEDRLLDLVDRGIVGFKTTDGAVVFPNPSIDYYVRSGTGYERSVVGVERQAGAAPQRTASELAAEQAQAEIEKERARNMPLGSGAVVTPPPERATLPPAAQNLMAQWNAERKASNGVPVPNRRALEEAEHERMNKADGIKSKTFWQRIKEFGSAVKNIASRTVPELPNRKTFSVAREWYRQSKSTRSVASDEAVTALGGVMSNMNEIEYQAFGDSVKSRALLSSMRDRDEPGWWGIPNTPEGIRRTLQWRDDTDKWIDALAQPDGSNRVKTALKHWNDVLEQLQDEIIKSDLIPSLKDMPKEQRAAYFHKQVLAFNQFGAQINTSRKGKLSAAIKRKTMDDTGGSVAWDEEYDPNADFVQSQAAWIMEMKARIREKELFNRLDQTYDIYERVSQQAEKNDDSDNWRRYVPETHEVWWETPRAPHYRTFAIPEQIAMEIMEGSEPSIAPDEIREVFAIGKKPKPKVYPKEVVALLRRMEAEARPKGLLGNVVKGWESVNAADKGWKLYKPWSFAKTWARDAYGNAEYMVASDPTDAKKIPQANSLTWDHFSGSLRSTEPLRAAKQWGLFDATFNAAELNDIRSHPAFYKAMRLGKFAEARNAILSMPRRGYEFLKNLKEYQDHVYRMATFLNVREKMQSGKPVHYHASKPSDVEYVRQTFGIDAAAAKIAREQYGDHRASIELASILSRSGFMQFARFQSHNLLAWPRMVANNFVYARMTAMSPSDRAKALGRTGLAATRFAAVRGAAFATKALLYQKALLALAAAATYAWNRLIWPEHEKKLPESIRNQPHLILPVRLDEKGNLIPEDWDGNTTTINNVGAIADWLANFGMFQLVNDLPELLDKQLKPDQYIVNWGKAILNRMVQQLGPASGKPMFELVTGKRLYPDAAHPTFTPRDQILADLVGGRDAYLAFRGYALDDGSIASPGGWMKTIANLSNEKQQAWLESHNVRELFLKSIGKGDENAGEHGAGQLGKLRRIAWAGRKDAFPGGLESFLKENKTDDPYKSLLQSLDRLDPMGRGKLTPVEERRMNEWMTPEQRRRMHIARDSAMDTYEKLFRWTDELKKDDPAWQQARDKWLAGKAKAVAANPPDPNDKKYQRPDEMEKFAGRLQDWEDSRARGLRDLKALRVSPERQFDAIRSQEPIPWTGKEQRSQEDRLMELYMRLTEAQK